MRIGVIGLGNPLQQDDGIGIVLVNKLNERKHLLPSDVEILDGGTGGMSLLHLFARFDVVFILDAVNFCRKPAESRLCTYDELLSKKTPITMSTHETDVLHVLRLAKELNQIPEEVYIFGVQPKTISPGMHLSRELQDAVPSLVETVVKKIVVLSQRKKR
ncbi:MAG: hydrogenase maturation protease [Euryarchaeota archaeon]|nr:hydrogenase maturation protease [Euryarchaeota archaeon]